MCVCLFVCLFLNEVIYSLLIENVLLFKETQAPTWPLPFYQNIDLGTACERINVTCVTHLHLLMVDVCMK